MTPELEQKIRELIAKHEHDYLHTERRNCEPEHIIPFVTIDGTTITKEQFVEAVKNSIMVWTKRVSRGYEYNKCALCELLRPNDSKKNTILHQACPLYDARHREENPHDLCCAEYHTWDNYRTSANAKAVLDKITAINWHDWASKYVAKPEPKAEFPQCGDCIHTEIRSDGLPCYGCMELPNHPNFKPKWEPKVGEYAWNTVDKEAVEITKIFDKYLVEVRISTGTKIATAITCLRPLTLADVTKDIDGVKVIANEDKDFGIWVSFNKGDTGTNESFEDDTEIVMRELLTLTGVPILPFKAWEQIKGEEK